MSRVWFSQALETVATFWRVGRRDGVTLGFTTHDRDLWFADVLHLAAPGMLPSAIRRSAELDADDAEVRGALGHGAIRAEDLAAGRFDGAVIRVGLVDWRSLEAAVLFRGTMGTVSQDGDAFSAELQSAKRLLDRELVPLTSPTCRAEFCGPGCNLSPARLEREVPVTGSDAGRQEVFIAGVDDTAAYSWGTLRWANGPNAGITCRIAEAGEGRVTVDRLPPLTAGTRAILREGCDHTIATCANRFGNAINFQGEPYLPGNDLLTRHSS